MYAWMAATLLRLCWEAGVAVGYLHGTGMARERDEAPIYATMSRLMTRRLARTESTPFSDSL
jgi:hypothetical protein